jgi:hypothetical protein
MLDLTDFTHHSMTPAEYRPMERSGVATLTERRVAGGDGRAIAEDIAGLERKQRPFDGCCGCFPRGFAFQLGEQRLHYNALRGTLEGNSSDRGDFVVVIPKLAIKAVRNNHVSELGISMFIGITLLRRIDPERFTLFALLRSMTMDLAQCRIAAAMVWAQDPISLRSTPAPAKP